MSLLIFIYLDIYATRVCGCICIQKRKNTTKYAKVYKIAVSGVRLSS